MGITEQGVEFLVSARRSGVSFVRTITIGRQFLLVSPDRLAHMLTGTADGRGGQEPTILPDDHDGFAEPLFEYLGATEPCSIDASDFEGATYSHDLNTPLPPVLSGRFSSVVDAGSLEHIFDVPTAMRNSMQMVDVGGHVLFMSPVNNAPGHGFYQFSPELFFRVLSPDNGFVVERMFLAEVRRGAMWYRVVDPADAGTRIEFTTRRQAYLYVQARKLGNCPVLATRPVQSDYQMQWQQGRSGEVSGGEPATAPTTQPEAQRPHAANGLAETLRATARRHKAIYVPVRAARRVPGRYRHYRHPLDPSHFQPVGRRLS